MDLFTILCTVVACAAVSAMVVIVVLAVALLRSEGVNPQTSESSTVVVPAHGE